jgi:hypothetical protein
VSIVVPVPSGSFLFPEGAFVGGILWAGLLGEDCSRVFLLEGGLFLLLLFVVADGTEEEMFSKSATAELRRLSTSDDCCRL